MTDLLRIFILASFFVLMGSLYRVTCDRFSPSGSVRELAAPNLIVIDAKAPSHPFPHFLGTDVWLGRAILSLREDYRSDLRAVKQITDFNYVRFHGIFNDEVGVYSEDSQGRAVYNFSYVDQIYDGLLANGVRPFVEISFMPNQLAASHTLQAFWYHPNVAPPKDWSRWDDLVAAFAHHLIERYGIDEVAQWYFEVWNEPNLDFWAGQPKQETYWELYDQTAAAIKKVSTATARRRTCHRAGRMGGRIHQALRREADSPRLRFNPRLCQRYRTRRLRNAGEHSSGSHGLPRSRKSAQPDQVFEHAEASADLERVQCQLQE